MRVVHMNWDGKLAMWCEVYRASLFLGRVQSKLCALTWLTAFLPVD
jgi:hypothetical protein